MTFSCEKGTARGPESIFAKMRASSMQFRLTGSRYFGFAEYGSDWDFFIGGSPSWGPKSIGCSKFTSVLSELESMGFTKIHSSGYEDNECEAVYRYGPDYSHRREEVEDRSKSVDVQVVKDPVVKQAAQEYIKYLWYSNNLGTSSLKVGEPLLMRHLWNLAYVTSQAGLNTREAVSYPYGRDVTEGEVKEFLRQCPIPE